MIRILIVDDLEKPEFIGQLQSDVKESTGSEVHTEHLNPTLSFQGGNSTTELKAFLRLVEEKAAEFWDIVLVDVNLNDVKLVGKKDKLHLALAVANHVRETNKSAIVILYSGTLSDHVKELLNVDEPAETALKRIYRTDIAAFTKRNAVTLQVIQCLTSPPFVLTVERALVENPTFLISDQEAEFKGKTLGQLAEAVRKQDRVGVRLVSLVAQHGVAAILDLSR